MPTLSSPSGSDLPFVCDCDEQHRSACQGEPFYKEQEGKRFCVLHFPGTDKIQDFNEAFQKKIQKGGDLDFQGVWFPDEAPFSRFTFQEADFSDATFNAKANFFRASFKEGAYFSGSTFKGETNFGGVRFAEGVNFGESAFFKKCDFTYATFSKEVDFTGTRFDAAVIFRDATFGGYVRFASREHPAFTDNSSLDLQFARIEKPDRISFHTVILRPSWFVNVDARNFRFTNVKWDWASVHQEVAAVQQTNLSPHLMLSIAYRNLAINAEESHLYEDASELRYRAMDARRLEHWYGFDVRRLSWWYWIASGYGERVLLAAAVLFGVMLISP